VHAPTNPSQSGETDLLFVSPDGLGTVEYVSFNLATILRETALARPDADALRIGGGATTYGQLDALSSQFAAGLAKAGVARGDVVAVQLPNVPQFLIAYFGSLKAGAIVVPLNPLLRKPEIEYHLTDSGAHLLVTFEAFLADAAPAAQAASVPVYVVSLSGAPAPDGAHAFDELLDHADRPGGDLEPTNADDTAVLIYTSGTTGKPKGAELTHFQLYMNCSVAGALFGAQPDDVALAVLPFFHVFGLSSVINLTVRHGGCLSIVPRFEPKAVLDAIEADGVSVIAGVPTMLQALAEQDISGRDLSRLRVAVSGGASLPEDVMRAFEEKFQIIVLEGYGLSETASTTSFNTSAENRKVLSIGKPIWGVEMRVADAEDHALPDGRDNVGEILIRGHNVTKGYWGRPEATAEAMRNGWFHTGDLGYRDEDGFYFVVDRSKDLVIRGGYNVYPREIEEVLFAHPAILEAAVIGKPDARLGEEVVAVVVLREGEALSAEDVIAYCKERLAAYKYPREVRFVDSIPKGPTGKVLKAELRAQA
jgi:long-chain acyl-CoA synthetase